MLIRFTDETTIFCSVINDIVAVMLGENEAVEHIFVENEIIVDFVFDDNVKAVLEIISTRSVMLAVHIMLPI